jgi:O-antigen/teichoic acid export membrane protein
MTLEGSHKQGDGTRSYLGKVSLRFVSGVVGLLLSTASSIVVARALGASGQGTAALLILIPTMFASLSSLGLSNANGYLAGARKHTPQALASNSVSVTIVLTLVTGVAYWMALPMSIEFLSDRSVDRSLLGVGFAIVPLSLLEMYLDGILLGLERIAQLSVVSVVRFSSLLALNVILVAVLRLGVAGALWAAIASPALAVVAQCFCLRGEATIRPGLDTRALRDSLFFGIQAHLGTIVAFLNQRLDIFILNFFSGPADVGLYTVATTLAGLPSHFPQAFSFILFPRTAASDPETAKAFTPRVARLSSLITALATAGLLLAGGPLLTLLYGEEFRPSIRPFWVLLPGAVMLSYSQVFFSDLGGRGKPYFGALASLSSLFVTVVGDVLLISRFGIAGAAMAALLARCTNAAVAIHSYLKVSGNRFSDVVLVQKSDIAVGISLGMEMTRRLARFAGRGNRSCG